MPEESESLVDKTAQELVGPHDDFLFLASASTVIGLELPDAWDRIEGDRGVGLLTSISDRFIERTFIDELPDGYACITRTRGGFFSRKSGYTSIVHVRRHAFLAERQLGAKTDLLCTTDFGAVPGGTEISYAQSYVAKRPSFDKGGITAMLQKHAEDIVTQRIAAIEAFCGGDQPSS